jgi:hypothetical protein
MISMIRKTIHRGGTIGITVASVALAMVGFRSTSLLAEGEAAGFRVMRASGARAPGPGAESRGPSRLTAGPEPGAEAREPTGVTAPRAEVRFEGKAAPGHRILLSAEGSQGRDLRYCWVQTQGPRVVLEEPGKPRTGVTVPEGAESLGFELVVANAMGMDTATLAIPIEGAASSGAMVLRADAGVDQIAMLGHQVTLNGIRSTPRGRIGYRWIQVGGPKVLMKIEEGFIYSFVPSMPGLYRFALVVSAGREISEPALVTVTVGSPSPAAPPASAAAAPAPESTQELARKVISSIRGGGDVAERLADSFDFTADRMELYQSYAETFGEMSRRLEEIVPSDPAWRALWVEKVFTPLTARLVETMLTEGLDLRRPEGQAAELTLGQKAQLAEQFREIAEGFRAAIPRPKMTVPTGSERAAQSGLEPGKGS